MSESSLGDQTEAIEADEEIPELVDEPDNDPDDSAPEPDAEDQDPEGTERPERDKHPED